MTRSGPALVLLVLTSAARAQVPGEIERLDPPQQGFYAKRIVVQGIAVLGHESVSDAALEEAARRIGGQLAHTRRTSRGWALRCTSSGRSSRPATCPSTAT
jgi:hypothetical protein